MEKVFLFTNCALFYFKMPYSNPEVVDMHLKHDLCKFPVNKSVIVLSVIQCNTDKRHK